jgi:hypothetical protein
MIYLEIHDTKDGLKTFKCGTRYDLYVIQKTKCYKHTIIIDQNMVKQNEDLNNWPFIPNFGFDNVRKLLAFDNDLRCSIEHSSSYHTCREHVSSNMNDIFRYPLIHSTNKSGVRYKYSSRNDKGHFNIPKIIFGETGINDCIIDDKGVYGMTDNSMAIKNDSIENLIEIKNYLESNDFKEILKACSWSNYRIDWRLFSYFRRDFWLSL